MNNRRKVVDIIISVLCSVALYAFVTNEIDPVKSKTVKDVPVQLLNVEEMEAAGLAISGDGEYKINVEATGSKNKLSSVDADDFVVTADVSSLHSGQQYITAVIETPDGISLGESTQTIQVYVENLITEDKPVSLIVQNLSDGTELGNTSGYIDTVTVNGAKTMVESVVSLEAAVDASVMTVDKSVDFEIELVPVDSQGNIVKGVNLDVTEIQFSSALYRTKEVALNVPFENEISEHLKVLSEIVPGSVVIKGPSAVLDEIWSVDAQAIDKSLITESCAVPVNVILPDGIELAKASHGISLTYELLGSVEVTLAFDASDIVCPGLADGMEIILDEPVTVTFSVFEDEVDLFDKDDIVLTLEGDLQYEGEYDMSLSVESVFEGSSLKIVSMPESLHIGIKKTEL